MSIKHAILGFLSWQPFTGYDLKKIFSGSEVFHWSGNSNQIYRALNQLHEAGWIDLEVQQQENLPPRKVYSLTREGRAELRAWVAAAPPLPELRSQFVVQLAWADLLGAAELKNLVDSYEDLLKERLQQVQAEQQVERERPARRAGTARPAAGATPTRTRREAALWELVADNGVAHTKAELAWIRKVRKRLEIKDRG